MGKKTAVLKQKSPAEFFAENKNIAGFDNEDASTLQYVNSSKIHLTQPRASVSFQREEISQANLNTIRGVANHERVDKELYTDFESAQAQKKRLAKEAKELERLEKAAAKKLGAPEALDAQKKELQARRLAALSKMTKNFYKVTVRDNGAGMRHEDVPNLLGRVLSGTKYGVCQTRGKFGLGAKMALIWSKMSTGLPIEVWAARPHQAFISHYRLDIDIHRNEPEVHLAEQQPNPERWHGATLSVTILGNWPYYRAKVLKYLRQIAVITPYAQFAFSFVPEDADATRSALAATFARRTDAMPAPPQEVKHHPASVDLELIKQLIAETACPTLHKFLAKEFSSISKEYAERLVSEMRCGADGDMSPRELAPPQVARLHQLLHEAKFPDPDGAHLSPAGEYNLRLGIIKEIHPDMVATYQGGMRVLEGHAFRVEAAVSLGGRDVKNGINIFRFANRIPLLFEGGSDLITKTALKRIAWGAYKMNQNTDRIGVFVSIVSTKIPYKGAGKEYIADDVDEMVQAVKHAIQQCCLQLKVKIARAMAAREQKLRKKCLVKYIPNAAAAIFKVLAVMAEGGGEPGPKRARLEEGDALLEGVRGGATTEATLAQRLAEHVDRVDTDLALEYQMQQGLVEGKKQSVYLMPRRAQHVYGPKLRACACSVQLLL